VLASCSTGGRDSADDDHGQPSSLQSSVSASPSVIFLFYFDVLSCAVCDQSLQALYWSIQLQSCQSVYSKLTYFTYLLITRVNKTGKIKQ